VLSETLDIVFPHSCAGCGRGPWPFCGACADALVALEPPWCGRCGRPTELAVDSCGDCPPSSIDLARSPFLFHGPARRAIHRLKFAGWRSVAEALAEAIAAATGPPPADAVTWVPLARSRLATCGYDQARVLARALAARTGAAALPLIRRAADTGPQARRAGVERRLALQGAFRPSGRRVPACVLLVDDVLTTGATADACARVLRQSGARRVSLVTAARAFSGPLPARYTRVKGPRLGLWLPGDVPR
jgi:predicted amidophosphoribosyltransferase